MGTHRNLYLVYRLICFFAYLCTLFRNFSEYIDFHYYRSIFSFICVRMGDHTISKHVSPIMEKRFPIFNVPFILVRVSIIRVA